jgi:peptidoglycan hydrolase-like protein with peptidoglycan-binding domain
MKNENKYTTMLLAYLTMITGLAISAVAIYYSVAGLVAIFAAAAIPIIIMGSTLEVAKLVTAVWLHRYWKQAAWWLRSYLAVAVIVLMFITSMGIFGFLSKAHIEQTTAGQESAAQVERINAEIARQQDIVKRAEDKTRLLQTTGSGADAQIQAQIDREQERIDNAYKRIQPAIDEQNKIIGSQAGLFTSELARIDASLAQLQTFINAGDIRKAQAMVGAKVDGDFGPSTAAKFKDWQAEQEAKRKEILTKIETATNNPQARAAAAEIKRLRLSAEREVAESNRLINRLRANVGKTTNAADIDKQVDEQNARIKEANTQLDTLTAEKYKLEGEFRKLEAEVGPIKYIAEFIYGEDADKNMLEKAVTWVIIIIIFVFDPLAVLLLIASQYTFEFHRNRKEEEREEMPSDEWELYEKARAERMEQNVPPTFTNVQDNTDAANDDIIETIPEQDVALEPEGLTQEQFDKLETVVIEDEVKVVTEEEWELLEASPEWQDAKTAWKTDNPTMSLKFFKDLFLKGKIDKLPWEDYLDNDSKKKSYMMKEDHQQIRKTTDPKP